MRRHAASPTSILRLTALFATLGLAGGLVAAGCGGGAASTDDQGGADSSAGTTDGSALGDGANTSGNSDGSGTQTVDSSTGGNVDATVGDGGGAKDSGAHDTGPVPDSALPCPYTGPPLVDPSGLPPCTPACAGAHCLPTALVPPSEVSLLTACGTGLSAGYCTPDDFISTLGSYVPPTCTSVAGSEGRCLSTCLGEIASEANLLPQSTCAAGTLCAPCYNPTAADASTPTGACSLSCDKPKDPPTILTCPYTGPPVIDPTIFPACAPACAGAHCVPSSLIPTAEQSQLAACPGGFCAPDSLTESAGDGVPDTCVSVAGLEGRCLSVCLPEISSEANLLPQSTCPSGELCAPCYNPTAENPSLATGACSLACDKPANPPTILTCPWTGPNVIDPSTFAACAPACSGAHCLPASLVPVAQQSELAACTGGFCTPDPIIATANNYVPPTCAPFSDPASEGRCTSDCLPAIAADASELVQATCSTGNLCAPCNDPFSGKSTGACALGCDSAKKPPFTFPLCCDSGGTTQGTCVPKSLVPSGEQGDLTQEECPSNAASYLCVPNEYLPTPTAPIDTCSTLLGAGACVSDCVSVTGSFLFSQDSCPANHICVPCTVAGIFGSKPPGCN